MSTRHVRPVLPERGAPGGRLEVDGADWSAEQAAPAGVRETGRHA